MFLRVAESDWIVANPSTADPVPITRLTVIRDGTMLTQGETPGVESCRPEVIAQHRAAYEQAIHTALTETVELLS